MAQKVVVELVDDLDGTTSDNISTVTFGLDGAGYEIDLTADNAERLHDALADFVAAARRTGGRRATSRRKRTKEATATTATTVTALPSSTSNREQTRAIRYWAQKNGYELGDRGRIPTNIVEAFDAAHATNGGNGGKGKGAKKARKPEPAFSS